MKLSWKKLVGYALAVVVGVVVIVELGARSAGLMAIPVVPEERYWSLDLHTNLYGQMDGRVTISILGRDVLRAKAPGEQRVLCLGSSSTFGAGLPNRDLAYPALLDQRLTDAQVFNAGFGGYNSFQLGILLADALAGVLPDVVTFYYGDNEGSGESAKPFYARAEAVVATLRARGVDDVDTLHHAVCHGTADRGALLALRILDRSAFFRWWRNKVATARYLTDLSTAKSVTRTYQPSAAAILEQMADLAAARGFTLVLIPEIGMAGGYANKEYFALMRDVCARGKAQCIDPLDDAFPQPTTGMFIDDTHMNGSGHRWLTGILEPKIRELLTAD